MAEKNRRELWSLVTYEKNTGSILAAAFGRGRKIVFKIRAEHFIFAKDFQRHAILEIHPGLLHKGIFFQDLRSLFAFVVLLRDEYRSLVEKQSLRAELLASIRPSTRSSSTRSQPPLPHWESTYLSRCSGEQP